MSVPYPYTTIEINHRIVAIDDIVRGVETGHTPFEKTTFDFIRRWFCDDQEFKLFTSGSTGDPKEIVLRRDQLRSSAELTARALDLAAGDVALVCLDTRYIAGQMMLVRSFTVGMRVLAIDPCANPFSRLDEQQLIDFAAWVPYNVYTVLWSADVNRINSLKTLIIGGAPLDLSAREQLQNCSCSCYETYGMTETLSHIALRRINGEDATTDFIALPGVVLSVDERSCLVIRVPYLTHDIITNDIVALTGTNRFQWVGRWDNIINSGGVKISPERIEKVLESVFLTINLHQRFIISGLPDDRFGSQVVLVLEGKLLDEAQKITLFEHLDAHLTNYERPKKILELPFFKETNTGKVDRRWIRNELSGQQQN